MLRFAISIACFITLFTPCAVRAAQPSIEPAARPSTTRVAGPHVRGATPRMERLLKEGIKRSPTFAALVAALDDSDVIVHVEETMNLPSGLNGLTALITSNSIVRYLRVQVMAGLSPSEAIAIAGHELQHALEVAAHAEVRDARTFEALYERIGVPTLRRGSFDTAAARSVGYRVRAELS